MLQPRAEERAALLLSAVDDEDDVNSNIGDEVNTPLSVLNNKRPVIARHLKADDHKNNSTIHPVLCLTLTLVAFILGAICGIIIILYRVSQENAQRQTPALSSDVLLALQKADSLIQTKLFESIDERDFLNLNRSIESEDDAVASIVYQQWKSFSPILTHVNRFSYNLLDEKGVKELLKIDVIYADKFLSLSSLVKSDTIDADSLYFVNYGRQEDFAYLFSNRIRFESPEKSIVLMRRKSTVISQTEQIHQAIYYRFGALMLFDDHENQVTTTTKARQSFFRDWARYRFPDDRKKYIDGVLNDDQHSIPVLTLSYKDILNLFEVLQQNSTRWLSCPIEWYNNSTPLKLGGMLPSMKLRLVVNMERENVQLPVIMSSIRGTTYADQFVMLGYQLGRALQNKVMYKIIEAYTNQIKSGWHPRRSILFCAWSGSDYDQYTVRRWISENYYFIEKNLVSYLDLGNGVLANGVLNLHGSPLLERVVRRAAESVVSPLEVDAACHQRPVIVMTAKEENHHHDRKRRTNVEHTRYAKGDQQNNTTCVAHSLLNDWTKAVRDQFGPNETFNIVQSIDTESIAALFQLQHGITALLIEMTPQEALPSNTFYVQHPSPIFQNGIRPKAHAAYTQFVTEIIRQLTDEPLVAFNLTDYAELLDKQVVQFVTNYNYNYQSLGTHLGDISDFSKTIHELTASLRKYQTCIDDTIQNDSIRSLSLNRPLFEFERLLISRERLPGMNSVDKIFKHILVGPAFGLTNTAVPFPLLSNMLFGMAEDPPTELCEASQFYWSKTKEQIRSINRVLSGLDSLFEKNK